MDDFTKTAMELADEMVKSEMDFWQAESTASRNACRFHSEHLRAALLAHLEGGWQPIETAPQTGRTLLLGYFNVLGKWRTLRGQWFSDAVILEEWTNSDVHEAGWFETSVECDDEDSGCWPTEPTHWMPLPRAPVDASRAASVNDRTCRIGGAYIDAKGATHILKPGDVVPADAKSYSMDNTFTSSGFGFRAASGAGEQKP